MGTCPHSPAVVARRLSHTCLGSCPDTKDSVGHEDHKIYPAVLTSSEKKKAMQSLLLLTEKRGGRVKGRAWLSKDVAASPTTSLEGILLTSIVDGNEIRDVMSTDIPNAFI
jgi:hypothetical protein